MFVLPSRGRPQNLQRLFDAWVKTKASTPVLLCVDWDDPCWPEYESMDMPSGWRVSTGIRGPLSRIYNDAFRRHPNEPFYGFIADDVVPVTEYWDTKLIEAAGKDGMAVPSGGETTGGVPHFVLGGDLVRSVGWLALPGLDRIFIDTVWRDIARKRNVLTFMPEVVIKHLHFSNGKALMDSTYRKLRKAEDKLIYDQWRENGYSTLDHRNPGLPDHQIQGTEGVSKSRN
jgi:hypothetical protein